MPFIALYVHLLTYLQNDLFKCKASRRFKKLQNQDHLDAMILNILYKYITAISIIYLYKISINSIYVCSKYFGKLYTYIQGYSYLIYRLERYPTFTKNST